MMVPIALVVAPRTLCGSPFDVVVVVVVVVVVDGLETPWMLAPPFTSDELSVVVVRLTVVVF